MKTVISLYLVALAAFLVMMVSCGDKGERTAQTIDAPKGESSYQIRGNDVRDTINITYNGSKQGKWIIRGRDKKDANYHPDAKVEEGFYKDNKKVGYWKRYYPEGGVKDSVLFENGVEVKR